MSAAVRPVVIPEAFWPILRAFNSHSVLYLVVGGHGVIYYGHPRVTADLDLLIEQSELNLSRLRMALAELGYSHTASAVTKDYQYYFTLGRPPFELDIIGGPTLEAVPELWTDYVHTTVSETNLPVRIISLAQLRASKIRLGRNKDLADVEELDARNSGTE
jgi:hypothetical protein